MKRGWFIFFLLVPFFLAGAVFKDYPREPSWVIYVLFGFYVPFITVLRLKLMGMTWKQVIYTIFGINWKQKLRIFTDK